MDCLGSALTNK
jgi:glycine hydroxymethyltransferase